MTVQYQPRVLFQVLQTVFDAKSFVCVIYFYNAQLWLLFCRLICLKGSDFDSKRSLLEAIRSGFPGGSVTFAPGIKNEQVSAFWHWLVSQYEPGSGVKVYNTDHLGAQVKDNYWILDGEVRLSSFNISLCIV